MKLINKKKKEDICMEINAKTIEGNDEEPFFEESA